jgi:hypothetical protein
LSLHKQNGYYARVAIVAISQNHQVGQRMGFWYYFWTANFIVAGSSFALITLVVMVRGSQDLRNMLRSLRKKNTASE